MTRQLLASGTRWESQVGYSRAVQVGSQIYISGTTATGPDGEIHGLGDPAAQMKQCLSNIEQALKKLEVANLEDVVRTRIYVVDIEAWETIGRVHAEVFHEIRPATSMVEVSRLISRRIVRWSHGACSRVSWSRNALSSSVSRAGYGRVLESDFSHRRRLLRPGPADSYINRRCQ